MLLTTDQQTGAKNLLGRVIFRLNYDYSVKEWRQFFAEYNG